MSEVKKANVISNHEKQKGIYKAFDSLRFAMLREVCGITHEDVGKIYHSSRDSEFYFPQKT